MNNSADNTSHKSQVWRELVLIRVTNARAMMAWIKTLDLPADQQRSPEALAALDDGIEKHLLAAEQAAINHGIGAGRAASGTAMESALGSLHAADELLLRRAPAAYVKGRLPDIHSDVRKYLDGNDPRRIRVEKIVHEGTGALNEEGKENLAIAVAAAHTSSRLEYAQVRTFRNTLLITALTLLALSVAVAVLGWLRPQDLALCFYPQELNKIVCPTNESRFDPAAAARDGTDVDEVVAQAARASDVLLIEFVGLVAAALSGSASLRKVRGSSTPFSLPVALAIVKLPTGALTAVVGLLLMRGGFVPGLSALDSSAQILAWAVIFGAAQQLITKFVDRQAHAVLNLVGGKPHSTAERPATE